MAYRVSTIRHIREADHCREQLHPQPHCRERQPHETEDTGPLWKSLSNKLVVVGVMEEGAEVDDGGEDADDQRPLLPMPLLLWLLRQHSNASGVARMEAQEDGGDDVVAANCFHRSQRQRLLRKYVDTGRHQQSTHY